MSDLSWIVLFCVVLPAIVGAAEWRRRVRKERDWFRMSGAGENVPREDAAPLSREVRRG